MLDDERRAVARRAPDLASRTPGRSGNVSVRAGDRFAITPSGVPYGDLGADDIPVVTLDGDGVTGSLEPSSETPMHAAVYRAFDVGAVLHTHSPWATTFAALRQPVPPVHYALARTGGRVPVAEYATYGSDELAANATAAMADAGATACLLANHGILATGSNLHDAFETLDAVEFTARVAAQATAVDEPVTLPADELERVAEKFATYGQE